MKWVGVLLVALSACSVGAEAPVQSAGLRADKNGLQPIGTALRIDFGRSEAGVVAAVSKLLGQQPTGRSINEECGAGRVTEVPWANGLTLNFQRGSFLGWTSRKERGAPVSTTLGLMPGQTQESLTAVSFKDTSLGSEFEADGVFGQVENSKVGLLWAGVTCFFR